MTLNMNLLRHNLPRKENTAFKMLDWQHARKQQQLVKEHEACMKHARKKENEQKKILFFFDILFRAVDESSKRQF